MAEPAAPKLDLKMLVVPAMFLLSRQVDMKNEKIVQYMQAGLITVSIIILSLHFYVYSKVLATKNTKKIWVPPKPKPQLPFNLGPPEEPVKAEDFEITTYPDHEVKLLKDSIGAAAMSIGISLLMSFKFGVHMSLMIQAVMLPLGLLDNLVFKKYIFSVIIPLKEGPLYNELESAPTPQMIATLNASKGLTVTAPATEGETKKGTTKKGLAGDINERVEELPDADDKNKEESKTNPNKTSTTPATDID